METLIHADIFFFVATIGFLLLGGLLAVALIYMIRLFRSVLRITKVIEKDVAVIGQETKDLIHGLRHSRTFAFLFGKSKK